MKFLHRLDPYYIGYTGRIVGIRSTYDVHFKSRVEHGTITRLFETRDFGWAVFTNNTGTHIICLG